MGEFWTALFSAQRTCVLHAAKQDQEVLWFEQGRVIGNLLDTQICAGLLGLPAQIGYAGLVRELLGIELSKSETRTDWTRRPLSAAQISYAAEDVVHLPQIRMLLTEKLQALGRYQWALEDSAALSDAGLYRPEPEDAWQRVKSIPFMPTSQQARARALAAWRETRAVEADKPRQWIMSDKALVQLSAVNPQSEQELRRLNELPESLVRNQGRRLLQAIEAANAAHADGGLQLQQTIVDPDREKMLSKRLGKVVREKAAELDIAPEVLASKRDISAIIRGGSESRAIRGWRHEQIGAQLLDNLARG
jgi:ribonuclease D